MRLLTLAKMRGRRIRAERVGGDVLGGLTSAVVSLGILLPLGLLSFAALGAEASGIGIRAAFAAAICGGLAATIVGGVRFPGTVPRTSTSLIFAGFVATLAADPQLRQGEVHDIATLVLLSSLCVGLAGMLQIAFGLARLGSLAGFVPLPVVAGFMDGIAVLIVISQLRTLSGVSGPVSPGDVEGALHRVQGAGLAVGLATVAFAWLVARRWRRVPWAMLGLAFGTVLDLGARRLFPGAELGPLLSAPAGGAPLPTALSPLLAAGVHAVVLAHLPQLLTTAVVLAVIGSMDALLAALGLDTTLNTTHRPNRLLVGQGIANVTAAVFGGIPVVYSMGVSLAASRAGGQGAATGWVAAGVLLLILVFGSHWVGRIPLTVSSGVMVVVALGLFDQWSRGVWREVRTGGRDRDAYWSLGVVVGVCVVTIVFGFVAAIAAGVLLSMALFIVAMNRSLLRSVATGATRASRRIYFPDQMRLLREQGDRIKIIELEGAIFFGTAETLSRQVGRLAAGARFVILNLRRVTTIDASGAMALERLSRRLDAAGATVLLAGLAAGDRHARALRAAGTFLREADRAWFGDADLALEHAERALLDEAGVDSPDVELPLERLSLLQDLDARQRATVTQRLERRTLAAGEVLFRAGEPGDRLYVLAQGSVSVLSGAGSTRNTAQRLASFTPGVIFGETAMLDGGGRTATAMADRPSVVYVLTRASLDEIRRIDPPLASQLLLNLAKQLSARLRNAAATIDAAADS